MIWVVDDFGNVAVFDASFISSCDDRRLALLLVRATWLLSMQQACDLSRLRRRRWGQR